MKAFAMTLLCIFSLTAVAQDYSDQLNWTQVGRVRTANLMGQPAEEVAKQLNVKETCTFSLVQSCTLKKRWSSLVAETEIECTRSILGDVPGEMSGPHYFCSIVQKFK